jgi:hypothetical protein
MYAPRTLQNAWPVEIKLIATPAAGHLAALNQFKELAGKDSAAQGVVVCRVAKRRPMPDNNLALPWQEFGDWLGRVVSS